MMYFMCYVIGTGDFVPMQEEIHFATLIKAETNGFRDMKQLTIWCAFAAR